jgi:hypothetical protein
MKFSVIEVYIQQRRDDNVLTAKVRQNIMPRSYAPEHEGIKTPFTSYGKNLLKKKPFVVDRIEEALFAATAELKGKSDKVRFVFEPFIGREPVEFTVS